MTEYAIKATHARAAEFDFPEQKTMYGGKHVAIGDRIYGFASGAGGLTFRGVVTDARLHPRYKGVARQTPLVGIAVAVDGFAQRLLKREDLIAFRSWGDGRPETELNFKLYRQATEKLVSISPAAARFLDTFF